MEQGWIIEPDSEADNTLNGQHTTLMIRDILSRDLRSGALASELTFGDDAILSFAQSLDRHLQKLPRRENNLFAVCWIKAQPLGRSGIRLSPSIDFFRKDDFIQLFTVIPLYETFILRDLPQIHYYDVLQLALQKTSVKPISLGSHTLLTNLLNAEVPKATGENKYGSIVRWLIKDFFTRTLKERWEFEHPFERRSSAANDELTAEEMEKMIREVYVFNKISLYQELSLVYAEFSNRV